MIPSAPGFEGPGARTVTGTLISEVFERGKLSARLSHLWLRSGRGGVAVRGAEARLRGHEPGGARGHDAAEGREDHRGLHEPAHEGDRADEEEEQPAARE